jgi:hypothetical protein
LSHPELFVLDALGMPIEFFHGRPLEPEELGIIRGALEKLDSLEGIDPELRVIVARNWPHLLSKLPPVKP